MTRVFERIPVSPGGSVFQRDHGVDPERMGLSSLFGSG